VYFHGEGALEEKGGEENRQEKIRINAGPCSIGTIRI
jgi:hypothetical protein